MWHCKYSLWNDLVMESLCAVCYYTTWRTQEICAFNGRVTHAQFNTIQLSTKISNLNSCLHTCMQNINLQIWFANSGQSLADENVMLFIFEHLMINLNCTCLVESSIACWIPYMWTSLANILSLSIGWKNSISNHVNYQWPFDYTIMNVRDRLVW